MGSKRPHFTRPKRSVRLSRHKRPSIPDLSSALHAFSEGLELAKAAHLVLQASDISGPAEVTLSKGIEVLDKVYDVIDKAVGQLAHIGRKPANLGSAQ